MIQESVLNKGRGVTGRRVDEVIRRGIQRTGASGEQSKVCGLETAIQTKVLNVTVNSLSHPEEHGLQST